MKLLQVLDNFLHFKEVHTLFCPEKDVLSNLPNKINFSSKNWVQKKFTVILIRLRSLQYPLIVQNLLLKIENYY